jgi:ankyrin repeat protein
MFSKLFQFTKTSKIDNYKYFLEELLKPSFNKEELEKFLDKNKIDINEKDSKGNTFLHHCIQKNVTDAALWILDQGIQVDIHNNSGYNSFHLALEHKHTKLLTEILSQEVINVNEKNKFGRIPLQDLVVEGEIELAKLLIKFGADINSKDNHHRNVIFDALSFGDENFISYLLELKDPSIDLNNLDDDLNTIMHHKEVENNETIAKKLIEAGADVTIQNAKGETFLTNLAKKGDKAKELLELALQNGADVNAKTTFDNTLLMELMKVFSMLPQSEKDRRRNIIEMCKMVVTYGGDLNAVNKDHESALFEAVRSNNLELVSFLLKTGINPNIINIYGNTPLLEVIYGGIKYLDILLVMLEYGSDPLIRNLHGYTIYEILNKIILHIHDKKTLEDQTMLSKIKKDGQYMVLLKELLQNNKQDLNFWDSEGNPLFFTPLLYDDGHLFKLYINNGLDIHALNKIGYNIFFAYVLKVFQDNDTSVNFQENLSRLISKKVTHNYQDALGWTVVHKILFTKCNKKLFDILTKIIKFDFTITDELGRSVVHNAVWNNNPEMVKKLHKIDSNVIHIVDNYGLPPIVYAALLGSQELVLLFMELGSYHIQRTSIPQNAIKKFSAMLKNLPKIKKNIEDKKLLEKIDALLYQIQVNFNVPPSLILE